MLLSCSDSDSSLSNCGCGSFSFVSIIVSRFWLAEPSNCKEKLTEGSEKLRTDSKGIVYKNSDNLESLLNNTNWKKVQK